VEPTAHKSAPADGRWELVLRVAESAHFQKSPKLREFLLYVCERTLQNRQDEVREHQIGNQVFGRRGNYSPAEDNIVRVEARQLRKRLDEYFAVEGKDEPIVIVIPKGTYIPTFAPRPTPEPVNGAAVAPAPAVAPSHGVARLAARYAVPVILLLACILLWKQNLDLRALADARANQKLAHPWAEVFDSSHQTYVVVADSARVLIQEILGRSVSLTEYLSRKRSPQSASPKPDINGILEMLSSRRYTSLADVILVGRILQLSPNYWPRTIIRSARDVEIRDFKTHNIILIGSARSTPWDELFDQVLNFNFRFDEKTKRAYFVNRNPKPGEQSAYYAGVNNGIAETYADVALVPNLNHTGNVLILAGANMEGTEAAGEFTANPERSGKLFRDLGLLKDGRLEYFEVLLKSRTVAGMARESDVVAWRILRDVAGHP
jgi:hypothetical protein